MRNQVLVSDPELLNFFEMASSSVARFPWKGLLPSTGGSTELKSRLMVEIHPLDSTNELSLRFHPARSCRKKTAYQLEDQ